MNNRPSNTTEPWLLELLECPDLLPRGLDLGNDRVLFTPMTEAGYRASSFLDSRAVRAEPREAALPLGGLVQRLERLGRPRVPVHFLFHIGHCGSTLVSRLLGELPGFLCLREPPPLLMLAQLLRCLEQPGMSLTLAQWSQLFDLVVRLLARTYRDAQVAVIKPMSHANNLMAPLLQWHPDCRGVFLYQDLETHLASMLQPKNRVETARAVQESRWHDFTRMTGTGNRQLSQLADGEQAALVWLVQMAEYEQTRELQGLGAQLLALHFDDFLADPASQLGAISTFLGQPASADAIAAVLAGPLLRSYSKAPAAAFSAQDRRRQLAVVAAEAGDQIGRGIAWAEQQALRHPVFAQVLRSYRRRP